MMTLMVTTMMMMAATTATTATTTMMMMMVVEVVAATAVISDSGDSVCCLYGLAVLRCSEGKGCLADDCTKNSCAKLHFRFFCYTVNEEKEEREGKFLSNLMGPKFMLLFFFPQWKYISEKRCLYIILLDN